MCILLPLGLHDNEINPRDSNIELYSYAAEMSKVLHYDQRLFSLVTCYLLLPCHLTFIACVSRFTHSPDCNSSQYHTAKISTLELIFS
jgi:hypothetical protein